MWKGIFFPTERCVMIRKNRIPKDRTSAAIWKTRVGEFKISSPQILPTKVPFFFMASHSPKYLRHSSNTNSPTNFPAKSPIPQQNSLRNSTPNLSPKQWQLVAVASPTLQHQQHQRPPT